MDLHSASYQNHLGTSAQPYLSLITSFGGLCILAHSGQGLLRQSRSVIRRVDQHEASHNYATVIYKLNLTNLKVNPAKTHCFLEFHHCLLDIEEGRLLRSIATPKELLI